MIRCEGWKKGSDVRAAVTLVFLTYLGARTAPFALATLQKVPDLVRLSADQIDIEHGIFQG